MSDELTIERIISEIKEIEAFCQFLKDRVKKEG